MSRARCKFCPRLPRSWSSTGIVREVIFPRVKEEIFRNLVAEFHISGPRLRLLRQTIMERKFARRMLPALLETLQFRSDNRFQPLIEGLAVIPEPLRQPPSAFPGDGSRRRCGYSRLLRLCDHHSAQRVTGPEDVGTQIVAERPFPGAAESQQKDAENREGAKRDCANFPRTDKKPCRLGRATATCG